ncbi:MAG: hypothetical protein FJ026_10595 [Chloroflexi bacterium]|nr:hypothetical protein [Chloroflexota bacterium]
MGATDASILLSTVGNIADFADEASWQRTSHRAAGEQFDPNGAQGLYRQAGLQAGTHRVGTVRAHRCTIQHLSAGILPAHRGHQGTANAIIALARQFLAVAHKH